MYSKNKWINILGTMLAMLSMGEIMLTTFLLLSLGDILYFTNCHYSTAFGFAASLFSLPTALKLKSIYSETDIRIHHLNLNSYHRYLLFVCCVIQVLAIIIVFIRICLCSNIHDSFLESMSRYQQRTSDKVFIDITQILLQCCGLNSYSDWFRYDLTNQYFSLQKERRSDIFTPFMIRKDTVPYSCCMMNSPESCTHVLLNDFGTMSINTNGCKHLLTGFVLSILISELIIYTSLAVIIIILLQMMRIDLNDPEKASFNDEYNSDRFKSLRNKSKSNTNKSWSGFTNSVETAHIVPSSHTEHKLQKSKSTSSKKVIWNKKPPSASKKESEVIDPSKLKLFS